MACFSDISASQGSVATYSGCGGIFNVHLTANLQWNLPMKKNVNLVRIDRIMVMSLWRSFLAHLVYLLTLCEIVMASCLHIAYVRIQRHEKTCT